MHDKYDDTKLIDICAKVMANRREILDKFAEAYLAENLKGTEIKNLTLNEQQVEAPGVGYKYWFSEELNVEWRDFDDMGLRGTEWVWVTDFESVWLSHPDHAMINTENRRWAKANIIHPQVPKRPTHRCTSAEPDGSYCEEQDGELFFHHWGSMTNLIGVKFCPFCGYKPNVKF